MKKITPLAPFLESLVLEIMKLTTSLEKETEVSLALREALIDSSSVSAILTNDSSLR
jgi:inactivated superfamily I helicase